MNLYLVERTDNWSYDDYNAFVCKANDIDEARRMWPNDFRVRDADGKLYFVYADGSRREETGSDGWPSNLMDIKAREIGVANDSEPGVVLASFNAG